jgi:hypothetical protein
MQLCEEPAIAAEGIRGDFEEERSQSRQIQNL